MSELIIKPWGAYEILLREERYQLKRLIIKPQAQLSYQSHEDRSESWVVVEGEGIVRLENKFVRAHPGNGFHIPAGMKHRVKNTNTVDDLVIVEAWHGFYLNEEDIKRYEDDYGRK